MKAIDLRELTVEELEERLEESKEELFNLRFQLATNQLDNTARLREVRKEVARIATVIREQELEAWAEQQQALEKEGK
jgi:large subunit ribosomal protein L29